MLNWQRLVVINLGLESVVVTTLPVLEHAAAQAKQRQLESKLLDELVDELTPQLPEEFYSKVADIGTEKGWRRLACASWPAALHYELRLQDGQVFWRLTDELKEGSLKTQLSAH